MDRGLCTAHISADADGLWQIFMVDGAYMLRTGMKRSVTLILLDIFRKIAKI